MTLFDKKISCLNLIDIFIATWPSTHRDLLNRIESPSPKNACAKFDRNLSSHSEEGCFKVISLLSLFCCYLPL